MLSPARANERRRSMARRAVLWRPLSHRPFPRRCSWCRRTLRTTSLLGPAPRANIRPGDHPASPREIAGPRRVSPASASAAIRAPCSSPMSGGQYLFGVESGTAETSVESGRPGLGLPTVAQAAGPTHVGMSRTNSRAGDRVTRPVASAGNPGAPALPLTIDLAASRLGGCPASSVTAGHRRDLRLWYQ